MIYGTRRMWSDETINGVLGIDDRHVVFRGHSTTFVYDHHDGSLVTDVDPKSITSGDPSLERVDVGARHQFAVSADGRWVAAASFGSRVRVFDNQTGEMKFADDPEYGYDGLAFSHDGTAIAALADGAWVYSATQPTRRARDLRYGIAFDAAGDLIGGDVGKLARWSVDGVERTRVSIRHKIDSLSISRDGRFASATTMCTGGLCMWPMPDVVVADLQRGTAILRFHDKSDVTRRAMLSPTARWLALMDDTGVRLMSADPRPAWNAPPVLAHWKDRVAIVMSPDDRALLFDDNNVGEVIALPSGERIGDPITIDREVHWSPDGRFLVELTPDCQHVRVHDASSFAIVNEHAFETRIDSIAISRDGTQLAVSDGPTIQIVAL